MKWKIVLLTCLAVALAGCLHGRGQHTVPVMRDYESMEKTLARDVEADVKKAHRVGGGVFAPFETYSAIKYYKIAKMERRESDRKGEWDYSALAKKYADMAIAKGGIPDGGELPMFDNHDECMAEFERLKRRYQELDPCKAKLVAPVPYAHIETMLSLAEHELAEWGHYVEATYYLRPIEADIDAIWAKDTDGDGVKDMQDGEPWIPEDMDGFQDGDGMPEPKPYPKLPAVHFADDSAKLSSDAKGYLRGIAKMLVDGYTEATVYIEGYTDSDASEEYNLKLSQRRVMAVQEYLVANGANPSRIKHSHKGEAAPVADNRSEAGQAQNRRVEIWLDSPDVKSPFCN